MAAANKEAEEASLQLKSSGSKVFSKLLSRESPVAAPSFRVYYGIASAGSVPFMWESQPGTPKNARSDTVLPPLTPPPSYYTAGKKVSSKGTGGGGRKYGILSLFLLPKIRLRRGGRPASGSPTSSCASSSTSSSSSSFYSSSSLSFRSTQSPTCSSMRSLQEHAHAFGDEDEDDGDDMAVAACFRVRHESFRAIKNCRVAMTVRSAIASAAGGGHGHGPSAAVQKAA